MMEQEKDAEAWLRKEIEKLGGVFWKFISPGQAGVPDRIAVLPGGRVVFVELKKENERLRPIQVYQIGKLVGGLGAQVCIVHGKKAARKFLEDMKEGSAASVNYHGSESFDFVNGMRDHYDL